jgi:hypothetical protein
MIEKSKMFFKNHSMATIPKMKSGKQDRAATLIKFGRKLALLNNNPNNENILGDYLSRRFFIKP